jgi:hypothetical protein
MHQRVDLELGVVERVRGRLHHVAVHDLADSSVQRHLQQTHHATPDSTLNPYVRDDSSPTPQHSPQRRSPNSKKRPLLAASLKPPRHDKGPFFSFAFIEERGLERPKMYKIEEFTVSKNPKIKIVRQTLKAFCGHHVFFKWSP